MYGFVVEGKTKGGQLKVCSGLASIHLMLQVLHCGDALWSCKSQICQKLGNEHAQL